MLNFDREDTLYNYWVTEDSITVNAQTYAISFRVEEEGVYFYAVCVRTHDVGPTILVPKELWERLDCGLKIAYTYNCVLTYIEEVLKGT